MKDEVTGLETVFWVHLEICCHTEKAAHRMMTQDLGSDAFLAESKMRRSTRPLHRGPPKEGSETP